MPQDCTKVQSVKEMIRIVHHQRSPCPSHVSIERLFAELRRNFSTGIDVQVAISPNLSQGFVRRCGNVKFARQQLADVHHIVGDAHYLAFGLPSQQAVLTIHDCAALNRLTGLKREALKYFWFTGPMRHSAVVTTISETTKAELQCWVGRLADRVRVVPNCVGSEFTPHPKSFDSSSPVVLQVGTGWNKNVVRVAEALRGSMARLLIVGQLSAAQRDQVLGTGISFEELGRVSDEDLLVAYRRADLVIFASLYEGFGLPILEAQATGRPVVTSNCSSMPEVAGQGALFVDPNQASEIRQAFDRLVGDAQLRSQLVDAGFENVAKYQPAAIAAKYEAIYQEVFAGERNELK